MLLLMLFIIFKELNRKECYNYILNYILEFTIKAKEGGSNE